MGYSPWGQKELDTTERLTLFSLSTFERRNLSEDLSNIFRNFKIEII